MGISATFRKGAKTVFKAFGDLVQSVTLTEPDSTPHTAKAIMVDAQSLGFKDSVTVRYQNGCLIQGYGLSVTPEKNWRLTDAAGKKWVIKEVLTDPAGAVHQALIVGGGA